MVMQCVLPFVILLFILHSSVMADPAMSMARPFVIAHRGASGYLPEHTQQAKAMAHAQGAAHLEQDVVLTRDDIPIVLHDIHLDTVTDVATKFHDRARSDGRYYAIDFTLAEIRQLVVSERFDPSTGQAIFPGRFPAHQGEFRLSTLEEEIRFIQGMNKSTGRAAGLYPEIKQPEFHLGEGKDLSKLVVECLQKHGYDKPGDLCFVQCFDQRELRRVREDLRCQLPLIQLLEQEDVAVYLKDQAVLTAFMRDIATYADGIGPNLSSVFDAGPHTSVLVQTAHAAGLKVHPWTCRADSLPPGFGSFEDLHQALLRVKIDAVFSDFPDQTRRLFEVQ